MDSPAPLQVEVGVFPVLGVEIFCRAMSQIGLGLRLGIPRRPSDSERTFDPGWDFQTWRYRLNRSRRVRDDGSGVNKVLESGRSGCVLTLLLSVGSAASRPKPAM